MWRLLIGVTVLLVAAALSACQTGGNQLLPCNEGGVLFYDDFSEGRNCGWLLYDQAGGKIAIADGVLVVTSRQPGEIRWTNPGRTFDDAVIRVTARQAAGPDDNAFGVICRYQNEQNFYLFLISGDGHYVIAKYQTGQPVQYISGNGRFQYHDAINKGVAVNELEASCIGNQLTWRVNGILLETITDPTFVRGDIGLGASPFDPGTTVIEFDDLVVFAP
ncbi:MAG: hypothetical protein KJ063_02735 [Anaerolineae bacterium]|nr:hypothetical protein [Anaerolineae bacterium]